MLIGLSFTLTTTVSATEYQFNYFFEPGSTYGQGNHINNNGEIVGLGATSSCNSPFLYSGGNISCISALSVANSINEAGQIVGKSPLPDSTAVFYENGNAYSLGTLGGNSSSAEDINNSGQIVGFSLINSNQTRAFIYDSVNGMQDLGTLGGNSLAYSVNNLGQVTGDAFDSNNQKRAFIYDSVSGMQNLGTLGGDYSEAREINDLGQVVGSSKNSSGIKRAFIYDSVNGMQDLGALGGQYSEAYGTNNSGQIVGRTGSSLKRQSPFLYENGEMFDLNALVNESLGEWQLNYAFSINDSGWITGVASNSTYGVSAPFLLTPVPEPSSYAMMGLGILGLVAVSQRRKLH